MATVVLELSPGRELEIGSGSENGVWKETITGHTGGQLRVRVRIKVSVNVS